MCPMWNRLRQHIKINTNKPICVMDLAESIRSREHWLWDTASKRDLICFVFYCFGNPSIAYNFGTTGPIQVGFSAKCTSPNELFNEIENRKYHIFDFRLTSLDRITSYSLWSHIIYPVLFAITCNNFISKTSSSFHCNWCC